MSSSQKALSKNFRSTAHAYLTEQVESGKVTSQTELIGVIKAQGWLINRAGSSYVTVGHPVCGRFRFRYVFGDEEGETVVYALIASAKGRHACYIGSTGDFYNRMCQHAKLVGKKRFTVQRASTEFFSWAALHGSEIRALELERLKGRGLLIAREAAWTHAAQRAGWLLPGVERWGAKIRSAVVCVPEMQHLRETLPDFATVDFSVARPLCEIANVGVTPRAAETTGEDRHAFGIQLLINPGNRRPFYVGLLRFDEGRMEPGSGAEVFACAMIVDAIQTSGLQPQEVLLEKVAGRQAVKQTKSFWIETLVRAGADLINSDRSDSQRKTALEVHLAALAPIVKPTTKQISVPDPLSQNEEEKPLPVRHGERWSPDEEDNARKSYLAGDDISMLSQKLQRKVTAVVAKLANLAQSDAALSQQLLQQGVIDQNGKPSYLSKP